MKEFRAIFPISSILVIRSGDAKKDHFPILAVVQNISFEFRTQKLPNISCISKCMGFT